MENSNKPKRRRVEIVNPKNDKILIRVSTAEKQMLHEASDARNETMSSLIMNAVYAYLNQQ